jgi:hypothetical protein
MASAWHLRRRRNLAVAPRLVWTVALSSTYSRGMAPWCARLLQIIVGVVAGWFGLLLVGLAYVTEGIIASAIILAIAAVIVVSAAIVVVRLSRIER